MSRRTGSSSSSHQNGFGAGPGGAGRGVTGRRRALLFDPWQVDPERRALADLTRHPDVAAALRHNPVHRRKSEAGAVADGLRREERFERPRLGRRVHAGAVVGHGHEPRTIRAAPRSESPAGTVDVRRVDRQGDHRCIIASRALTARFMMTCSIWPGSAFTRRPAALDRQTRCPHRACGGASIPSVPPPRKGRGLAEPPSPSG